MRQQRNTIGAAGHDEAVLRLYHDQPLTYVVHGYHERPAAPRGATQGKTAGSFTKRYDIDQLVYAEVTDDVLAAIQREKQIKGWNRSKKVTLIEALNPRWKDLSEEWFGEARDGLSPFGEPPRSRGDSSLRSE